MCYGNSSVVFSFCWDWKSKSWQNINHERNEYTEWEYVEYFKIETCCHDMDGSVQVTSHVQAVNKRSLSGIENLTLNRELQCCLFWDKGAKSIICVLTDRYSNPMLSFKKQMAKLEMRFDSCLHYLYLYWYQNNNISDTSIPDSWWCWVNPIIRSQNWADHRDYT